MLRKKIILTELGFARYHVSHEGLMTCAEMVAEFSGVELLLSFCCFVVLVTFF